MVRLGFIIGFIALIGVVLSGLAAYRVHDQELAIDGIALSRAIDVHDAYRFRRKGCVSFIFRLTSIARKFFRDAAALNSVQSRRQVKQMWRQSGRSRGNCVTQPFANLRADCTAMDAIDLNTVWLLVGHGGCRLQWDLPDQLPEGALVHYGHREQKA